jgi:hypothetical protein
MFHIGQKVICIDATGTGDRLHHGRDLLTEDNVYTIRWLDMYPHPLTGDLALCMRLDEIYRDNCSCEWCQGYPDMPYYTRRFRPLVERKTDISWAQEILRSLNARMPQRV